MNSIIEIDLMTTVTGTATNTEALPLFLSIKDAIMAQKKVKLSMRNATPMSSSFLNSSFGELVEVFGVEKFKSSIQFTNCKMADFNRIKCYISNIENICC